jgi:hypothetical protein
VGSEMCIRDRSLENEITADKACAAGNYSP